jgi:peptide/nickel transport system substrate-binding protein
MKKNKGDLMIKSFLMVVALMASSFAMAANNEELKIGSAQEYDTLNPLIMSQAISGFIHSMNARTLVTLDADSNWIPQLAKEIPTLENGKAKLVDIGGKKKIVAVWEIIDSAKWGDGNPLTCADFAFSLKVAAAPTVSVAEKETYTQVEKIDFDPKTPKKCTFTYEKAKWDFNRLGQFYPLPKHLEEPIFNKYGKEKEGYEKNSLYVKNPSHPGLNNGPYLITEVKLGDHVSFAPNPYFYGQPPKIKKIILKFISNTGTMEANLVSGTIDMISTTGLKLDQAVALDKKLRAQKLPFEVLFVPSVTYEHIDLNLSNPILKDLKVRKALLHAVNRQELVKALFDGKQTAALHFMTPKDPWYTADPKYVAIYNYSRREAQKLLDEAGWKVGADGYRSKDGKKMTFTIMTTAGDKTRETVESYLQEQWKQVGVDVQIKNEIARTFFSETTRKRKFDGMALYAWISSPENNPRSTYSTASIPTSKNGWSGQNTTGWSNPRVDQIVDQLDVEFSPKKRAELAWELQKLYTEDIPVLPLYYRSDIAVIPAGLKNFRLTGHQFPETNEVEKWSF